MNITLLIFWSFFQLTIIVKDVNDNTPYFTKTYDKILTIDEEHNEMLELYSKIEAKDDDGTGKNINNLKVYQNTSLSIFHNICKNKYIILNCIQIRRCT